MRRVYIELPPGFKTRMGIPRGAYDWWVYWTPAGDEAMSGYLLDRTSGSVYAEQTGDFRPFLELIRVNFHLQKEKIGDSDNQAECVLLCQDRNYFICPMEELHRKLKHYRNGGVF